MRRTWILRTSILSVTLLFGYSGTVEAQVADVCATPEQTIEVKTPLFTKLRPRSWISEPAD
jgi:hypothetical protein